MTRSRLDKLIDAIVLAGLCLCLASILTFGFVPLCVVDSVVRGYVSGYLTLGDLSKWGGSWMLNIMCLSTTFVISMALATFLHHLRTGRGWSLAVCGGLSLSAVTIALPLIRVAKLVFSSIASICSKRLVVDVDYGYVIYVGPHTCYLNGYAALALVSFLVASIGASAGVLVKWFEFASRR